MTQHVHQLTGCRPTPLAHYLKALGVLRLVAEQADPEVRGWWQDEHFHLVTELDRDALIQFFANDYTPTPLIAPWNSGSGFYPKDNSSGIDAIARSSGARLTSYRQAIDAGRAVTEDRVASPAKGLEKQQFLAHVVRAWRSPLLDWLQAALVLNDRLEPSYPALLGTGGNDGRLDFTNNFMQRLAELFDLQSPDNESTSSAVSQLTAALWLEVPTPRLFSRKAIGQFLPGQAGGANSSNGFMGDGLINPWDYVLMLEGAIVFAAGLTRRANSHDLALASAPFAMRNSAVGFATATSGEESPRGEQWLPLWAAPSSFRDIRAVFAEARCQSSSRPASRPSETARAVACHGTARGITAFERVAYLERNGQANLAISLGRWRVSSQPFGELTDHAARWIDRLRAKARGDSAPSSWQRAARRGEEAVMGCCREGRNPDRWFELLLALGAAEETLGQSAVKAVDAGLQPLRGLPGGWLRALQLGNGKRLATVRLALALADQVGLDDDGKRAFHDPVRRHCLPLERDQEGRCNARSFTKHRNAEHVALSGYFQHSMLAILRRRLRHRPQGRFPLISARHQSAASLTDLAGLLRGDVDEALVWSLARPLMALDHRGASELPRPPTTRDTTNELAAFGLLRLAHAPGPIVSDSSQQGVRCDPAIITRLLADDAAGATRIAVARLRHAGLRPHLATMVADNRYSRRLATALMFPLAQDGYQSLARSFVHVTMPSPATSASEE